MGNPPIDVLRRAAEVLVSRRNAVALTGAGISVESGIPSFRGRQGMWAKYDPAEYASLAAFLRNPEKSWEMFSEMIAVLAGALPNAAHRGLAELENRGILRSIITQNVDGLHQAAGSRRVIEYHGNTSFLVCLSCWKRYPSGERIADGIPPRCDCGEILKPDVVLFGEPIPWGPQEDAETEAQECSVLLVVGTSAQVTPACDLPGISRDHGAFILEINPEETHLTRTVTDLYLPGSASDVVAKLLGLAGIPFEGGPPPH